MKKINVFALIVLLALGSQAAVRDEWTFQNDTKGTLLANAANSGLDGSAFESGGAGVLEADGLGALLSTPSAPTLWGKGATLDADITDTNTLFLRYDLDYNLSSGSNTVGTSIGLSFVDSTGTNISGLVFAYNPTGLGSAPDGETLTPVISTLPLTGTLSAIAAVGPNNISVWYSTNGVDFVVGATNMTVSITSIADLRIQATGTASPSGFGDFVAVENIRVADTWASIAGSVQPSVESKYLNEWLFDRDAAGRTLSEAINSGTDRAVFSVDTARITQTDGLRSLICRNDVADTGNLWTNGAVLTASVSNQTSGVRFLRYDLDYDMTATNNNTGTLLGLGFSDGTGTNLAGVVLKSHVGSVNAAPPPDIAYTQIGADMGTNGSLSVIAKVDLDTQSIEVWYDLTGSNSFNASNAPNGVVSNLNLTTISQLEFRATGDFIASAASNECVVIDNIRTAASWAEIIEPPVYLLLPPKLTVSINGSGGMAVGQTNTISVTIHNSGGSATNVSSTLVHDGGAGLSIISSNNAATPIAAGGSAVQTYLVVANPSADGPYILTAQATIAGTNSGASATFDLFVGSQISFVSAFVTNDVGGVLPGEVEPGESFDLIITSINDGGVSVSGITNSLTAANASYFPTIIPSNSATYASLAVGSTTSTTYRVTCLASTPNGLQIFTVINRTAGAAWTNQFQINVRREANLLLSTNALTIRVAPGATGSASGTLSNAGNVAGSFTVTADGRRPFTYDVEVQSERRQPFGLADFYPDTVFTNWSGTTSGSMNIGFGFSLFGVQYTTFTVSQYGFITLGSTGSATARVIPFQTATAVNQSTIRYKKTADRLVIAWGNDGVENNGTEFQVWLNADGTVEYLYELGTWGSGTIALGDQPVTHTPGQTGQDSLLLSPANFWVTYTPQSGPIGVNGTQTLTFSAVAPAWQPLGTHTFTATVDWGAGSATVNVSVIVETNRVQLLVPASFTFSGLAGTISPPATMTVTNSGNVPLTYTITDTGVRNAGYSFNGTAGYQWTDIPAAANYILTGAELGTRSVPIGFPFVFFGTTYTNLTVGVDGTLTLGSSTNQIIPFSGGLSLDGNSSVRFFTDLSLTRFIATWENLAQPGGGTDQTVQAVLCRDGRIRFNYQRLSGNWPAGIIRLKGSTTVSGTLSNSTTTVRTTNLVTTTGYVTNWIGNFSIVLATNVVVGTNVVVDYTDTANRQALEFTPGKLRIITFSPVSGTIPEGQTANITLIGDARSLTSGGANTVSTNTTLSFGYGSTSKSVAVTFNATNSAVTAYPDRIVQAAMWGAETPVVSSVQNNDGSRTLSWPAANDTLSRTYTVLYTTSLSAPWQWLAAVTNGTTYVDNNHIKEPVIFYKVTVE